MGTIKLQDTSSIIGNRSRLENYWKQNGFEKFYTKFREGKKLPLQFQTVDSLEKLIKLFKLNAVGFGNWTTQEDRFNYISALTIALHDINKVLKFKSNNIGLHNTLSFSFGARGQGSAVAHFEPTTFIINVTRYRDFSGIEKQNRFLLTGGAGSVAHEYGHALDYYFGIFKEAETTTAALSGGRTTRQTVTSNTPLRKAVNELLNKIIWKSYGKELSAYYNRLKYNFSGDYMFRRNEIFARAFEKYIQVKLFKLKISNKFLNETKYDTRAYLTDAEMNKLLPEFDKVINLMRNKL